MTATDDLAIAYRLAPVGPPLYPRLLSGCVWCGERSHWDPPPGTACPLRHALARPAAARAA